MDFAPVVPPSTAKPLRLEPFQALMLAPGRVADPASARALARPYRDVAARLAEWTLRGDAVRDDSPAVYLHEYTSGGMTIRGLVGLLDVSTRAVTARERAVWPHEAIHPEQAAELADRMEEMRLNPAPILLVHDGAAAVRDLIREISSRPPAWSYVDRAGHSQRIWAIRDGDDLAALDAGLSDAHCLLADGHHRYAAYLTLQERNPGTEWDRGLVMVVDQADTPLFLGPIHRALVGIRLDDLHEAVRKHGGSVVLLPPQDALGRLAPGSFVTTDGQRWAAVTPELAAGDTIVEWMVRALLPALGAPADVGYHHSVEETLSVVDDDTAGILLPSLDFTQVRAVVESGRLLPEKATSFQPKPGLGAIMRPLPSEAP